MADAVVLTGIVRPTGRSKRPIVAGFRVDASLLRAVTIEDGDDETITVLAAGSGVVDADGAFRLSLDGDGTPEPPITVTVSTADGVRVHRSEITLEQASRPLTLSVRGLPPLEIQPSEDPGRGNPLVLTGRVIDDQGRAVPAGLPVVLWGELAKAAEGDAPTPHPLVITQTQAGGYFSGGWVANTLTTAFGRVDGSAPIPVRLDDAQRLPLRVLLVLDLALPDGGDVPSVKPPSVPSPDDLVNNPAAFSQDLGRGCVDLTTPNRAIEEFTYTMVVRTSEPDVKGRTLGVRKVVPRKALAQLVEASLLQETLERGAIASRDLSGLRGLALDVTSAQHLVAGDHAPSVAEITRAAWLSDVGRVKDLISVAVTDPVVRRPLDAGHPIDWDATPTIYQAITIARGHILELREVWRADGYSLGDLLYSLPLAPGQRRQVAVVDWERRSTTTRQEALEFEEELQSFVGRDRDVSEIVGSRLSEDTAAASKNKTWGMAGGIGAGFIGSGFGIFGGVAGSSGGSSSTAWQDSARQFSADSLQTLRDRVMQRASAVRDERSTVVQTAAQGETMRAETETVANYNHCHAMTVEYFEVLRHFLISHEVADVRECLFVPLPMSEFDAAKALRWQTPLARQLRDRGLVAGFDALRRAADNWVGWDYPLSRYSEEPPEEVEGELRVSFVLPRPRDGQDGAFQIDFWKPYRTWLWMDPFELWTAQIERGIAAANAGAIAERDRQFREHVAPEIAKRVVDRLRFSYITTAGAEVELPLDGTLVSRYAEGTPLYVSLRPRGGLPAIPREQIAQFKISLDGGELPPDAQVIVHSGKARYRAEHKAYVLFDDGRILNDLSDGDPVLVPTPTSWAETRNPRQEDLRLGANLVAHLNEALEYYHQAIWMWLDPQRRFMLLDGIVVPGLGGRSVASVVENRVIGIAGNSMILPVAPGISIDPRVNTDQEGELRDLYAADAPPPVRVSVPTRGVYAEAILGDCNGCEEIHDERYWRWTDAGMLALPTIEPVDTGTRTDGEDDLTPTKLPTPLVQIQNAPDLPAPAGLGEVFKLLGRSDLFTDITGLEGTQRNARAAFDAALSAASSMAGQAAGIAKQQIAADNGERMLDRIGSAREQQLLTPEVATELATKVLGSMVGAPGEAADKKADSPLADPDVSKAIDKAAQSDKAAVKVSTSDESIELSFDGGDVKAGGGSSAVGVVDVDGWVKQHVIVETAIPTAGGLTLATVDIAKLSALKAAYPAQVAAIDGTFLRADPALKDRYELFRRLRITYPADPKATKKVAGSGRLPVAVLVHGQHASWQTGEVRNHDGYAYLQDHLARQGIVSVSVDTNAANFFDSLTEMRAAMTLGAVDALRALDGDASSRFHHRLDFDRVGLMGHSRGGDAVVRAALMNATNKRCVVKAVAAIAPTDFTGTLVAAQQRRPAAGDAGFLMVLYGGLDGDVSGAGGARGFAGTGFRTYDRATAPKAMIYVPGCCHNRFNHTWTADDFGVLPADTGRLHSRADHEQLAIEYVGGLLEWKLLGRAGPAARFNGRAVNTLGHPTSTRWSWGRRSKLLDDFESPASAPAGTRTVAGADIAPFADVVVNANPLEPNTAHQTTILAVKSGLAGPPPSALKLALAAGHRDWTGFELLTLDLGTWVDVTSEATIAAGVSPPPLAVMIVDGAGKSAKADAVSFTTPDLPGRPVFHKVDTRTSGVVNASLHRLATCAITVSGFTGVDLADVRTLEVVPAAGFPQRVFLDAIGLVTP